MAEDNQKRSSKKNSPDWLVSGVLAKLGETFDRLTGRNWKPSSSLATSELGEKMKTLLDAEVKDLGEKGKFVPHNIKLKMQWDKFSTDADSALKKLEYELLTIAIDHINDKRYHTYAPIKMEIKPDYFTEGVKLMASFDKFADEDGREAIVNVSVPDLKNVILSLPEEVQVEPDREIFVVEFVTDNKPKRVELTLTDGERLSVGRTKENDLVIDDQSISKIHAALVLNSETQLMVADTGSTNGTFINGQRIAYGRAFPIKNGDKINFGTVAASFEHIPKIVEEVTAEEFMTNRDFKTQDVSADFASQNVSERESLSSPTVNISKQEVTAHNDFKTQPDFSTKSDIFKTEPSLTVNKEFETNEKISSLDNIKPEEIDTTRERIELNFSDKK